MTLPNFQLKALRYLHPVDLADRESVRKLVIWLENQKIREYKIEDRKPLADTQSPKWDAAFKKYLGDLECPVPPTDTAAALHWLVAFALNLDYEDNADKLGKLGAPPTSQPAASATPEAPASAPAPGSGPGSGLGGSSRTGAEEAFSDLHDPRVVAAVLQLVRAAQVAGPRDGGDGPQVSSTQPLPVVDQLMAAAQRCVCELGPALRPGVWNPARPPRQALAGVPLGFEVEGEALSAAATALRLLFTRDLRRLQSQIDHAVVEMQEYTANPKTDSSLGKVGR
ncbi:hypothetical protein PLESTB_001692400 [Pleodorina starrii]|uniref:Uncharacterized protein n=1 Tax=Pleodorina starrii TaxID=330485 RepID=A0A9W6F9S2_9CHLO|nr:hypothetical protein PLESTB_001692400 [Pleodorina starrii]GLC75765.1 hypothetical protein PLESTF_001683200 [Pleodorina starrii]